MHGFAIRFDDDPEPTPPVSDPQPMSKAAVRLLSAHRRLVQRAPDVADLDVATVGSAHHFPIEVPRAPERRRGKPVPVFSHRLAK
jgi:hypothetical protein